MTTECADCGALLTGAGSCEACFHALLAYENERPEAFGAVHHLTVTCYYLQHPDGHTPEILRAWHQLLAASRGAGETPRDLRRRIGRQFGGATRVREPDAVRPDWWPRAWPMHVRDVLTPDEVPAVDEYVRRARRWAAETLATLDRARVDAP